MPAIHLHHEEADDRRQHRQQRGDDHLLDRGTRQDVDGAGVVRLLGALHDAGLLAELAAHLLDDRAGRAADGRHGDAAEQVGQQAAEQQADHDVGVGEREIDLQVVEDRAGLRLADEELQVLVVGGEQHQRAEAGRADGIALGDGLGGVADRVERVGGLADLLGQARHLGDAAGVVGDRTEGVERHHHAGQRQHAGHRDGDAEQAGQLEGDDDAGDDDRAPAGRSLRARRRGPG